MKANILVYPTLLVSAFAVMAVYLQNGPLAMVATTLVFLHCLLLLAALRRKSEALVLPPEFQAKMASLEHQNQRQAKQQLEAESEALALANKNQEQATQLESLSRQIKTYESALSKAHALGSEAKGHEELAVIQFVRNLQNRGRFLDFLMADIHKLPDQQVGAAARVVHQGLSELLQDYFSIRPIATAAEGSMITLPQETELGVAYKLLQSRGDPLPSQGRLIHKGWQVGTLKLPQSQKTESAGARLVLAPAEVDVGEVQ